MVFGMLEHTFKIFTTVITKISLQAKVGGGTFRAEMGVEQHHQIFNLALRNTF